MAEEPGGKYKWGGHKMRPDIQQMVGGAMERDMIGIWSERYGR